MAALGSYLLLAAFVACAYAGAMCVAGARRRSRALIESGIGAFYLVAALMTVVSAIIVHAFVIGDYSIKYVQRYSETAQPLFYKLTSYWGGLDGSVMFWVFLLSLFGSAAVYVNRERHRELMPYVVAVLSAVQMFFLFLMVVHNNPFETFLTQVPENGRGLTPLLQNFYMAIHPPTVYLGFVGLTIPYAFAMAALISGHLDDSWLRAVRRWTMVAWLFHTVGLMLGMIWAYEELGWGGYWFWDPVENAALLPWFTSTAFLHSAMVQERRGMLRIWNMTLIIITFFLTIFGTFMTRSGIVQSVHAFAEDPALARMFTIFMAVVLVFSFGWVIYRRPMLKARNELDSWLSREAAFLANNWVLLFAAVFVLSATMLPTLSEAYDGQRRTFGPPFFNKGMLPIGLFLLALTGIGPLLAWRRSTIVNLRDSFLIPVLCGTVVGAVVIGLGVRVWASGLCFALSGFVTGTVLQEFWRGARVRQGTTGTDLFTALIGLVGRNKRRYGGYIVHIGVVLIFLGFAGRAFKQEESALLKPGQQVEVGAFTIRHDALSVTDDAQKQMVTAQLTVFENGKELQRMYPARWYFRNHADEPTTEVAIRRGVMEDLYVAMPSFTVASQSASIEVILNPLVNWIWVGFGWIAIGCVIALLPETVFAFAGAHVSANAVTTALLLVAVLGPPAPAHAQHAPTGQTVDAKARTPLEREVGRALICMCGGCGRQLAGECTCEVAARMREEIAGLVTQGRTKQQILQYYVEKYGSQQPLAEPRDEGFARLVWLVPYALAVGGFLIVVASAWRWSRPSLSIVGMPTSVDPALDARLDDELRNLD